MTASPPLDISLFSLLHGMLGDRVPVLKCAKATLVHLSHTLEDLILKHHIPAMLFTGFQESSHWREETARYRALAGVAQQVCIFAGGTLPPESNARELHVTLQGGDPLRQEWFLAILSAKFCVVLCGQDRQERAAEEAARQFDTIWSFEPRVIDQVLDLLDEVVARYRPERLPELRTTRASIPLQPPDPMLMTVLTAELIRFEEQLHQSLHTTMQTLEQQMHWRTQLIEALVHDMRTPLQGLIQTIEFAQSESGLEPSILQEMLDLASFSANSLAQMVQLILDTNRLEEGQLSLNWQQVTPQPWLKEALSPLEATLKFARVKIDIQIRPEINTFWCDTGLLARVLQNLVGNASKYTPPQGTITVVLARSESAPELLVQVRDTGVGIAPAMLPHIFDRYYQGPRNARQGSGIGLYFCRLAVEAHGGNIRAASQLEQGTTISISLPLAPPMPEAATGF